jgi:hypothetical protein
MAGPPKVGMPKRKFRLRDLSYVDFRKRKVLMKIRYILILLPFYALQAQAAPGDMTVSVWDPGCNHTMTTNHFVLTPGQKSHKVFLDLGKCSKEQMGNMLVFGYITTKNRSRHFTAKDKITLEMGCMDGVGDLEHYIGSASGSMLNEMGGPSTGCWVMAINNNRNKSFKIRLRSQLIPPELMAQ